VCVRAVLKGVEYEMVAVFLHIYHCNKHVCMCVCVCVCSCACVQDL